MFKTNYKEFKEIYTNLVKVHDGNIVFRDWLDYCIDQFLINPDLKYFKHEDYSKKEYEDFFNLFRAWVTGMDNVLESKAWYDLLGVYYEEIKSSSKSKDLGQFFTPYSVAEIMAEISKTNGICYDPAGGSGRFCLAYHVRHPKDLCINHDVEEFSCKMAVLNFLIHGVKGSVCQMDSLTGEFYKGWKINEFPFSIMEVDTLGESLIFIGEKINLNKKDDIKKEGQLKLSDY